MARMHTRKHGKSKSRRPPIDKVSVDASEAKKGEVENLIREYFKQGMPVEMIGQVLKDKHNIKYLRPILGMRLNEFLMHEGLTRPLPPDLLNLMKRAVRIRAHLAKNHNDVHNKTSLTRVESKIWRLSKYYKSTGKLPKDWHYDPGQAALIIKAA